MRLVAPLSLIPLLCLPVLGQNYSIYTFAGGVLPNNVSATSVPLPYVPGIAVDKAGNSYFAATSWNAVFRVDAATGQLTRFAGSGIEGYSGDNGPAISAQLYQPFGVAVDASGSVYIADTWNNVIRKVSNGVITTIAGNGTNGYSGDNGPATKAEMEQPLAVAVDASGNVYIADEGNNVIRKVSSGTIATIAGNGTKGYSGDNGPATSAELTWPCGVGVDASGNVYVADTYNNVVRKVSNGTITPFAGNGTGGYAGDNGPAANAQLSLPYGVGVDASGNVYIADYGNGGIRKVSNGTITTIAGNGTQGYSGDNGPATSAELKWPRGVAVDTSGNVYIADTGNYVVRKVSNGVIATLAGGASGIFGDNGPASGALLIQPYGVAVDAAGNLYVADTDNYAVRKISNGVISTIAGNGREGYSGDNGPATSAELGPSQSLAVDTSGNVYIADADDQVIRKVSNGVITTFAGNGSRGYSGDDGPATSAMLLFPNGVAADASGNVYIADSGNRVIRKVSNGVITTFAGNGSQGYSGDHGPAASAQLNSPDGVAVDASGTVYIADSGNYAIRKVSNGVITTIAGNGSYGYSGDNGAATSAELGFPAAVAVDPAGDVYIADTDNDVIRRISNGVIATIAGFDSVGYSGDNGPATSATLRWPWGVAVDASGKVYIADTDNNVIRVLVPTLSAQAASLTAKSASGSLQVDVPAGVHWTASSNDSWITITGGSSGTGSGTVSFSVQADTGAARTGTLTIDGLTFTIEQESSSTTGLSLAGSMAQIASAGGWDTSLTLVNLGTAAGQARLNFFANDGSTPLLPFTFPQQSSQGAMLGSTFAETLGAGATLVLDTTGPATQAATVGSSQLLTSGNIGGFAIFKYTPTGQEAVVPLETRNAGSYVLAFDNTGPLGTGLAVANLAASAANIRVVLRDDTGAQIGTGSISLRGQGHNSFMLTDATNGFPITANKRGTVEFDTPQGGQISVLGLRANGAALTSLPLLANVGATGGTMAHVASGGGWQTIFTLVNTGTTSATATLNFFGDDGSALSLPLSFPQTGTAATESSLSQAIPAGATLVIVTQGLNSGASATGSAQLTTNGQVSGFAIFQNTAAGQEAVVPLEVGSAKSYMLAFDNTSSLATGIALSNGSGQAAAVSATLRDATGATLTTTTINLPASGHKSEMLTDLFAAAANIRGTLEFDTPTGGHIAALGIRATPAGAFTTIPVMTM